MSQRISVGTGCPVSKVVLRVLATKEGKVLYGKKGLSLPRDPRASLMSIGHSRVQITLSGEIVRMESFGKLRRETLTQVRRGCRGIVQYAGSKGGTKVPR